MMRELAIIVASVITCAEPKMENWSNLAWIKHDYETLASIQKNGRCEVNVPGNPCVKRFIKKGYNEYKVMCGK